MLESWMRERIRRGQGWLQAQVQQALARASIPLTSSTEHQPPMYWGTHAAPRMTLYVWLAEEQEPRQLRFTRGLVGDCGAGVRLCQAYARAYIARSLRHMHIAPPVPRTAPSALPVTKPERAP